jgi:hypothetical protein
MTKKKAEEEAEMEKDKDIDLTRKSAEEIIEDRDCSLVCTDINRSRRAKIHSRVLSGLLL